MSLESDVIAFIQDYSAKNEGGPPSKNAIVKGVPGLHNSKFYDLFGPSLMPRARYRVSPDIWESY